MFFSRVALFVAIATSVHGDNGFGLNCIEDETCRTQICDVYDAVCPEEYVCEQLTEYPWVNCEPADELKSCQESMACREVICDVFDQTSDEPACEPNELCEPSSQYPFYSCHEAAPIEKEHPSCVDYCAVDAECHDMDEDGIVCVCGDYRIVPQGQLCEPEEPACGLSCGGGAECATDGVDSYCICEDGRLMEPGVDCPAYRPPAGEPLPVPTEDECHKCGDDKQCEESEFGGHGCFCNGLEVHPSYPCHYPAPEEEEGMESSEEEIIPLNVNCFSNPCDPASEAACFMEHGVPVCRCEDGDKVTDGEVCGQTEFEADDAEECGEFHICGYGAVCHYQIYEGYYCKCDGVLVSHYFDCPVH